MTRVLDHRRKKLVWLELIKNYRRKEDFVKKKEKPRLGWISSGLDELFWSRTLDINCRKLCFVQRTG